MNLLIVDLDGTVADWTERHQKAGPEPTRDDKKRYFKWLLSIQNPETLSQDLPVPQMRELLYQFTGTYEIVYLTARDEQYREVSKQWLEGNSFPSGEILMRSPSDYRSSEEYKGDKIADLQRLFKPNLIMTLDDDPTGKCAAVYKKLGVLHLKPTFCAA